MIWAPPVGVGPGRRALDTLRRDNNSMFNEHAASAAGPGGPAV